MTMERTRKILGHLEIATRLESNETLQTNRVEATSPFLVGGFEPVRKEYDTAECLTTFGRIPTDLDGVYFKNGPNSFFDPPADAPYHWFDGDGMIHAVDIREGRATYSNRYVNTIRLQQDKARGSSVYNMGQLHHGDLAATLDERVMDEKGRLYGRMNTNVSFGESESSIPSNKLTIKPR